MSTSDSALSIAVSALSAQSYNLSLISTNLANSSTVGYKEVEANFKTLITDSYAGGSKGTGGVLVSTVQLVDNQGVIETSDVATYMAIDGNGFFVVTGASDSDEMLYTRTGTFSADPEGYLVNKNGYYLQGWAVDADGTLTGAASASSLEAINVNSIAGSADATENIDIVANLPAEAAVGDVFTTSSEIYDALGTSHTLTYNWTKTGANTWTLAIDDPTLTADSNTTSGTMSADVYTITFSDGALDSITDSGGNTVTEATFSVTGWNTGASDSTLTIDLGTSGSTDGLSQFDSGEDTAQISLTSVEQDGLEFGELSSVYINDDGMVIAYFENGTSRPIYQIPLATFNNPNGLEAITGNAYKETVESGDYTLNVPGAGAAGTVSGYATESSTVSTAAELTDMIVAQQAYSAASQVISTTQDMFDSLIGAAR